MNETKVAMAQPHFFQSGALSFMSCTSGRESSPVDENDSHQPLDFKTETKKKKFHPLRNLRRMFRRKGRRSSVSADSYQVGNSENPEIPSANLEQRSCSTSKLQEENSTQNLIRSNRLTPGLSLSHDSVFTPDRADSGLSSSDLGNSSLSITVLTPSRESHIKSQSSCSESSLLSLGSSEVELSPIKSGKNSDLDLGVTAYKLSHSAAKHKMAVKPKRNHGVPRSRRRPMTSKSPLPTTIEVSEEGATGRSSPPPEQENEELSKITWTQTIVQLNSEDKEEKNSDIPQLEDEQDGKEEAVNSKVESFFGRFLSRKSEKRKKQLQESQPEDSGNEEKSSNFGKKVSKPGKSANRRQRIEPVDLPSSPNVVRKEVCEKENETQTEKSVPVSPKSHVLTNQSSPLPASPTQIRWPETISCYVKPNEESSSVWTKPRIPNEISNTDKDFKNLNFLKELTDSVSLVHKGESERKNKEQEDSEKEKSEPQVEEKSHVIVRQNSENTEGMSSLIIENAPPSALTPTLLESTENSLSIEEDVSQDETFSWENKCIYESVHDGYENVKIIELVKKEVKVEKPVNVEENSKNDPEVEKPLITTLDINKFDEEPVHIDKEEKVKERAEEKKLEVTVEATKVEEEKSGENMKEEKETVKKPEISKRVKPAVSEKPKDLKIVSSSAFMRFNHNKPESKNVVESNETKSENVSPKTRSTLVERRKSELLLLTESEEKAILKPLVKQQSFKEPSIRRKNEENNQEVTTKESGTCEDINAGEVVLRRKSIPCQSDEPELMKVFARRSLKVKESEKIVEEILRSRDSDKENEVVESPKERKKSFEEEKREGDIMGVEGNKVTARVKSSSNEVKVNVTPLKPEITSRKNVIQKYGRSLSENNVKKEETEGSGKASSVLEENNLNKMKNVTEITLSPVKKEQIEEEEETGFKRIQQRKAEWERRAQQGAK